KKHGILADRERLSRVADLGRACPVPSGIAGVLQRNRFLGKLIHMSFFLWRWLAFSLVAFLPTPKNAAQQLGTNGAAAPYEFRQEHDRDGIGKFYLGREIAHVMGHQGADWLERPERIEEENPDKLIDLLDLKPGE